MKTYIQYINEAKKSKNIFDAAENGDLNYIKRHINKSNIDSKDKDGWTALMTASRYGFLDIVKYLIEQGADINLKDNDGWTALMIASYNNLFDIIKYLIENGADINIKSNSGYPLYSCNKNYFNSYKFQKWFMDVIGNYDKLNQFVQGNIDDKIKKEYADDVYKSDIGL